MGAAFPPGFVGVLAPDSTEPLPAMPRPYTDHPNDLPLVLARQPWYTIGARPLRRTLQKRVESPMSVKLLRGEFKAGDIVVIDTDEEGLSFQKAESATMTMTLPKETEVEIE